MKKLAIGSGVLFLVIAAGVAIFVQHGKYDLTKVLGWNEGSTPAEETQSASQSAPMTSGARRADPANDTEKQPDGALAAIPDLRQPESSSRKPGFDIARIHPDGVSVFAGQGTPSQTVNVLADGVLVGSAKVDANGEWVLVTERKIASADPELSLEIATGEAVGSHDQVAHAADAPGTNAQGAKAPGANAPGANALGQSADLGKDNAADAGAAAGPGGARNDEPSSKVSDINNKMLDDLQRMVDSARRDGAGASSPASAKATEDEAHSGKSDEPDKVAMAAQQAPKAVKPAAPQRADNEKTVPIPIHFVYREATFTPDGEKAANLLLQYLRAGKHEQVTLSGHADERGTIALNMELSVERLRRVEKYLRSGGFAGKLVLLPKGETEPFTGVDRASFSKEELFQLDRRVELHLTN